MKKNSTLLLVCFTFLTTFAKHITVVTASYNNKDYYQKNLDSVFQQTHKDWHLIYIDDFSTDHTAELVEEYIRKQNFTDQVTLIKNSERQGALANQYKAISQAKDDSIVMILDGDDFLAHQDVLAYISDFYSRYDVWLTYGQFKHLSNGLRGFCSPMPEYIVRNNLFRKHQDTPSHLRTFYAALFKKIKKEDLQLNNSFYEMTGDMAAMIPMIEMARNNHFAFIPEILLIYNDLNSLNDHKVSQTKQRSIDQHIRNLTPYDALENLFE